MKTATMFFILVIIILLITFYFGFLWKPEKAGAPTVLKENSLPVFKGPPAGEIPKIKGPSSPPPRD